jgi:hypothetical protein
LESLALAPVFVPVRRLVPLVVILIAFISRADDFEHADNFEPTTAKRAES